MWLNNTIQEHDTGAAAEPNKRCRRLLTLYEYNNLWRKAGWVTRLR